MTKYVKHETWTADGSRQVIHVYEVNPDRSLKFIKTFSSVIEMNFGGMGNAIDIREWVR